MNRRRFLALIGKAALVAPLLPTLMAVEAPETAQAATEALSASEAPTIAPAAKNGLSSPVFERISVDTTPLAEASVPGDLPLRAVFDTTPDPGESLRTFWVRPKIMVSRPQRPTKDDPLGELGFVAMKYSVHGTLYGDWIKITGNMGNWESIQQEAWTTLLAYSEEKLRRIDPDARFMNTLLEVA